MSLQAALLMKLSCVSCARFRLTSLGFLPRLLLVHYHAPLLLRIFLSGFVFRPTLGPDRHPSISFVSYFVSLTFVLGTFPLRSAFYPISCGILDGGRRTSVNDRSWTHLLAPTLAPLDLVDLDTPPCFMRISDLLPKIDHRLTSDSYFFFRFWCFSFFRRLALTGHRFLPYGTNFIMAPFSFRSNS